MGSVMESLGSMWNVANEYFGLYMGSGLIVIWYLAATIYLALTEKRKHIRILFVYVPVITLLIYFNPLFTWVVYNYIDSEIYYRVLWLLPITAVLAFTTVEIYGKLREKKKVLFAVVTAVLVMVSGSYVYHDGFFGEAENLYHIPQSVVDICDAIEVEGREVMAVFPEELLQYVRQYSPVVCMPYGREVTVDRWNDEWHYASSNKLYQAMEADVINAEKLAKRAKDQLCAYIILPDDKEINGDLSDYDFEVFGSVEGYVIYKDSTVILEY